jgi:ElaB/YqjD/DUF883 family membrane-anchored ribosome-binding protein
MNTPDQPDPINTPETDAASCVGRIRDKAQKEIQSRWDEVASTTVGDLASIIKAKARKHPTIAMAVAAAVGFFLGRLFRR